jgi:N-acetylneuraminic acid mutarotase
MNKLIFCLFLFAFPSILNAQDTAKVDNHPGWKIIATQNLPERRQDCSFIKVGNLFYLVGGRGIKPVEVFDPETNSWQRKGNTPVEMNHFQAVAYKNKVYVVGGMYGHFPHEKPFENIYIYDTQKDEWQKGPEMPAGRLRGSGGCVVYKNKIYLICGIQDGHYDGTVGWMDEFDPADGKWRKLADAPHARDHFHAVVINDKLYLTGGRRTSIKTNQVAQLTIPEIDVYDFKKQAWNTLPASQNLPTQRAGCAAVNFKGKLVIIGGENVAQKESRHEVEAYDPKTGTWTKLPSLVTGRHDSQAIVYKNRIYIAAGSANIGPDLDSIEVLEQ